MRHLWGFKVSVESESAYSARQDPPLHDVWPFASYIRRSARGKHDLYSEACFRTKNVVSIFGLRFSSMHA